MKKLMVLPIVILLTMYSCELIQQEVEFPLKYNISSVIEANYNTNISTIDTTDHLNLNQVAFLEERDTRYDLIEHVEPMYIVVRKVSPSYSSLELMRNIEIFLISDDGKKSALLTGSYHITYRDSIVLGANSQDVTDLFRYEKCRLFVRYNYEYAVTNDINVDIELLFDVKAKKR